MPQIIMRALRTVIRPDHFKIACYGPVQDGINCRTQIQYKIQHIGKYQQNLGGMYCHVSLCAMQSSTELVV